MNQGPTNESGALNGEGFIFTNHNNDPNNNKNDGSNTTTNIGTTTTTSSSVAPVNGNHNKWVTESFEVKSHPKLSSQHQEPKIGVRNDNDGIIAVHDVNGTFAPVMTTIAETSDNNTDPFQGVEEGNGSSMMDIDNNDHGPNGPSSSSFGTSFESLSSSSPSTSKPSTSLPSITAVSSTNPSLHFEGTNTATTATATGGDVVVADENAMMEVDDTPQQQPMETTTFTHALFGATTTTAKKQEENEEIPTTAITIPTTAEANNTKPLKVPPTEPSIQEEHPQQGAKKEETRTTTTPMGGDNESTSKKTNEGGGDNDDDDDVEVLTKKQAEKEWRRKRKRKLQTLLEGNNGDKNVTPSFVAILEGPIEIAEDDDHQEPSSKDQEKDDENITITKIVINVDEYLNLGGFRKAAAAVPVLSRSASAVSSGIPPIRTTPPVPSSILSASPVTSAASNTGAPPVDPDPKEEGYYEGIKLMAMPEDEIYLSEMQQWVRQNLEFFSATEMDAQMSQSGRRQRTVRGKVGVRCVHCARTLLPKFESKLNTNAIKYEQWPPGSVSYPATMDGLYSSCSQRPQLHFKTCPHMSAAMRIQGSQWLFSSGGEAGGGAEGGGGGSQTTGRKRKRCREGVSALMYYHIACSRIGLVETPGGLRFTRDLSLEPLPLEQAKHKIETTKPELLVKPRQRQASSSYQPMTATSSSASASQVKMEKTPCTNEECQQILQEALQEEDDLSVRLACKADNEMVSDYTFLAIKQMALCHASPLDFVSRGKKTKLMRLGFAGFCCRHCNDKNNVTHACRSYSSAPDNLASAISNSFVLHLAKCPNTPDKIKQGLIALKKIHSRQMQQLPYGSQRKCFMELWRRMRSSDKIIEGQENPTPDQIAEASAEAGIAVSSAALPDSVRSSSIETAIESNRKNARSSGFPVSSNENTLQVLKKSEEEWDPTKDNDGLLDKDDRFLVSDYVFLTMRQLDQALPTSADFRGNRRQNTVQRMAGMKCSHCSKDQGFVGSGRSFPSAPDNMASAFNTSLYNHMQACPGVPVELKGALYDLRKIHSLQCQNLVFGSQRKFFNKVFAKLKKIPIPESVLKALPPVPAPSPSKKATYGSSSYVSIPTASDETLQKHSFVIGPALEGFPAFYQCQRCRAVPLVFRAPGCVQNSRPTNHVVVKHGMMCQGDGIFMGCVKKEFDALTEDFEFLSQLAPFRELVRHLVGNHDDLTELFSNPEADAKKDTSGWWRRLPATVDFDQAQKLFETVASDLKMSSTRLEDQPKLLRYLQTISPSFQLPPPAAKKDAGKEEDVNQKTNLLGDKAEANGNGEALSQNPEAADVTMGESSVTSDNGVSATAAASSAPSNSTMDATTQPAGTPVVDAKPDVTLSATHIKSPVTASSGEEKEIVVNDSSDEEGVFV